MFSKNIKILSLFLILAVVMIGALGAVSAAPAVPSGTNDGSVNATVNSVDTNNITAVNTSANASGIIAGTVVTTTDSNHSEIPSGSAVNNNNAKDDYTITIDGYVYTLNGTGYTKVNTVTSTFEQKDVNTTSGTFNGTLNLTNALNKLTPGSTYYVQVTVPQLITENAAGDQYATVNTTTAYLKFVYNAPQIVLDNNATSVVIGDNTWSFSGTVYNADGTIAKNQNVKVTVAGADEPTTADVNTGDSGKFTVYSTSFGNQSAIGNKAITFAIGQLQTTATLNVTAINANIKASLNQTSTSFGVPVNMTVTFVDANGKLINMSNQLITITGISTTGQKVSTSLNANENGTANDATFANDFLPGTYYITLSANNAKYNITPATLTLTVTEVATSVTSNVTTLYTNPSAADNKIKFTTNTTTGKENVAGTMSFMIYDANGVPVDTIASKAGPTAEVTVPTLKTGSYTLVATWTPTSSGYTPSSVTVPIVVKSTLALTTNSTTITYDFGTTGNATYLTVTADPAINGTVTLYNGNKTLGTVTLTDGKGTLDLGALSLAAGTYNNITLAYAGDDTYNPVTTVPITVTVNPVQIGTLRTNTTTITVNLTSNDTIKLTLTNKTNATKLVDYTGDVAYTVGGVEKGNVSMVNGVAIVPVASLNGLTATNNDVKFKILNDVKSNEVTVTVTATKISTAIVTDNITTNNATPITIAGTVTNATTGTVTVTIKKDSTPIATLTNVPVAKDGSFSASFGALANGNYTATIAYSGSALSDAATDLDINVTVNGTAPTPVSGNITTILTINNFTDVVNAGQNLTGKLTDANGNPIIGHHVLLNLSRNGSWSNKTYWVTTDINGEFQLPINLAVGSYSVIANYYGITVGNTTYLPSGPVTASITVNNGTEPVDNRTAVVLTANNFTSNVKGQNFTGTLFANGTPLIGHTVVLKLVNAKTGANKVYYANVDLEGGFQLEINLNPGNFYIEASYAGTSVYQPAAANATVVRT